MARTSWKRAMKEGIPLIMQQCEVVNAPMTVRRAFYLFFSAGLIKNSLSQYKHLSRKLKEARLSGRLPWEYIIDDSSTLIDLNIKGTEYAKIPDYKTFMDDPTEEQENYVEVWIEKAGNIPIFRPICRKYFVRLIVTGGHPSITYKHEVAERLREWSGKRRIILYLSDFDADGEYFPTELANYLSDEEGVDVEVRKIALNVVHVQQYSLPVSAGKYSKSKHSMKHYVRDFIAKYGKVQVELDAMDVQSLRQVLEDELAQLIDMGIIDEVRKRSQADAKDTIDKAAIEYVEGLA